MGPQGVAIGLLRQCFASAGKLVSNGCCKVIIVKQGGVSGSWRMVGRSFCLLLWEIGVNVCYLYVGFEGEYLERQKPDWCPPPAARTGATCGNLFKVNAKICAEPSEKPDAQKSTTVTPSEFPCPRVTFCCDVRPPFVLFASDAIWGRCTWGD
ncbi:hypothetical protein EVAR_76508_1 [Eumeta japonica]|uniref:Uncharacterized protein n=1 Tax=Eumeta variegata TaxID=151549 RepID=A0A4C1T5L4_EUMVA|nr:hypothetical protein EVAR_76508_1 [Eumeta japonica]